MSEWILPALVAVAVGLVGNWILRRDTARSRDLRALIVARLGLDSPCAGGRHSPADLECLGWGLFAGGVLIHCKACGAEFHVRRRSRDTDETFVLVPSEATP